MFDYDKLAAHLIATRHAATNVGMKPPFYAETASAKGDESWPYWIVRNVACNSLGRLMDRSEAERLAAAMNEAANA